jgi:hypothetical protein
MRPALEALCVWCSLVIPSLSVVHKYAGWTGTIAYAALAALGVASRRRVPVPRSVHAVRWLAAATFVFVLVAFLVIYPIVNVHSAGAGSDDDDTYNIGAGSLMAGRSPYDQTTYLGNALHPFAGAFVLAMPFVLLGTSAWQNLFWLPMFFLAVKATTRDDRVTLRLAWLVLALSPTVMHQVVTGTGHAANTIYVLLGLWWLTRTAHRDLAAVAWGVTLASRANFLFLVPIVFGWLRQHHGRRAAARATALTCTVVACLTLPFYLHDPAAFGPLEGANRLLRFNDLIPYTGEIIMVLMAILAVGLSFMPTNNVALFASCAIVQAFPVVVGTMLGTVQRGQPDLAYAAYFTFAAWFALMAAAINE